MLLEKQNSKVHLLKSSATRIKYEANKIQDNPSKAEPDINPLELKETKQTNTEKCEKCEYIV